METPRGYTAAEKVRLILTVLVVAVVALTLVAMPFLFPSIAQLSSKSGSGALSAAPAASAPTTHVELDIMPVKNGGPAENWPAYEASTPLTVPANTVVTVTIRNFDLGDAALTPNSPLARVQGTVGGVASFNGQQYTSLDAAKVSHTFTIPQLGINVPIPGDAPNNDSYLTVTFSFRADKAGVYTFQCFAPCGTGTGFGGPMQSMAYMKGTLTVQG